MEKSIVQPTQTPAPNLVIPATPAVPAIIATTTSTGTTTTIISTATTTVTGSPTGICQVRNSYTSVVAFSAPNLGIGYAKLAKPGVNTISELRSACAQSDYNTLLINYCTLNSSPVQQEVVTYDSQGRWLSTGGGPFGDNPVSCSVASTATAPVLPSNFSATVSGTTVTLTWTDNANNESGFSILRQNPNGTSYSWGISPNTQNATDDNLAGGAYTYAIMAYNSYGNSGWSSSVSATVGGSSATLDTTPPSTPAAPTVSMPNSPTWIELSWPAVTDNVGVVGYKIYRKCVSCDNASGLVYLTSVTRTAHTDYDGITQFTKYTYAVSAYDVAGNESAQSPGASVVTYPAPAISIPSASQTINLSWSSWSSWSATAGIAGYKIYRCVCGNASNMAYLANVTGLSYSDTGLAGFTTYSYTVAAYDAAGNELVQSPGVSGTTGIAPTATTTSLDLRSINLAAISQAFAVIREQLLRLLQELNFRR